MKKWFLRKYIIIIILTCLATMPMETIEAVNIEKLDYLLGLPIGEIHNEKIYQRFAKGQCTWYAWGRFHEVHHKRIRFKAKAGLDAKLWPELVVNCKIDNNLTEQCVAVSLLGRYGHLVFIEHIHNGFIYYTEANGDANGIYNHGVDCVLRREEIDSVFWKQFTKFIHQ